MSKGRLEAFSDGVIAIIITIMVLELRPPTGSELGALGALWHDFLAYVLSFVFIGIYWNNHHHMLHAASRISGGILWANLHLLFWLSIVPFVTAWMGRTEFDPVPVAAYGFVLLMDAIAYTILLRLLIARHGRDSTLARAIGSDVKGWVSLAIYLVAMPLALVAPRVAFTLYVIVAAIWLVPDRRIERQLKGGEGYTG